MNKILHICAVGFTVKNLLKPQIDYFVSQGLSVEIACSPGKEVKELQQQGYVIHPIPIDRRIAPVSNLQSIIKLTKLISKNNYNLVHVHTPMASVLGRIAAKIAGTKRIIYTAHGFYFHDNMPKNKYRFYHTIETGAAWFTDLILTQSREDLETATTTGLCEEEKVGYLGNGVDVARFRRSNSTSSQQESLRQELGLPEQGAPIIAMTGRITAEKGYLELMEALVILRERFPNLHLLCIGGELSSERDSFQCQLNELIEKHNLDSHVTLTGLRSDIPELLGLVDLFTLPSYREGLPRSILEAMAMELPVVTTDIRGCREAVVDGKTGFLVPPQNSEQLAAALGNLLADKSMRETFGKAGRQRVENEYDEALVFRRLESTYQKLGIL